MRLDKGDRIGNITVRLPNGKVTFKITGQKYRNLDPGEHLFTGERKLSNGIGKRDFFCTHESQIKAVTLISNFDSSNLSFGSNNCAQGFGFRSAMAGNEEKAPNPLRHFIRTNSHFQRNTLRDGIQSDHEHRFTLELRISWISRSKR